MGLMTTGLGCFLDDAVLSYFGLEKTDYQTMYHLTTGSSSEEDGRFISYNYNEHMYDLKEEKTS
jgi:hypothetical protein